MKKLLLLILITVNLALAIVPGAIYALTDASQVHLQWERVMLAYAAVMFVDALYIANRMMRDIERGDL